MGHTPGYLVQGLPKYQHVERFGHEDCEGLLDQEVYVQEKVDGANLTVAKVGGELVIASRNNAVSIAGKPAKGFNGAIQHVLSQPGIYAFFEQYPNHILRGEWLVRHALNYDAGKMGMFYVFDVEAPELYQDEGEENYVLKYLDPIDYIPILESFSIPYIKTQARGIFSITDLVELSKVPSDYNTSITREGIVVKRIGFRNKFDRTTWGKMISREFEEKKALHTHIRNQDPTEIRFAALSVTRELVLKEMAKIGEREGRESNIRDMGELIGRTWHAVFTEELWDFVKKERVSKFDFRQAQHLVIEKVRDIALAHYNGLPEGFNVKPQIEGQNQGGGNGDVRIREDTPQSDAGNMPVPQTSEEKPKWWSVKEACEVVDPHTTPGTKHGSGDQNET